MQSSQSTTELQGDLLVPIVLDGTDVCYQNPCQNFGSCIPTSQAHQTYSCSCLETYFGTNCEIGKMISCLLVTVTTEKMQF